MSHTYHIIPTDGQITTAEWTEPLEYGAPPFERIRSMLGFTPGTCLEHVSVLWKGKRAHMFVDEEGLLKRLPFNLRATRIYANATLSRSPECHDLLYNDLAARAGLTSTEFQRNPLTLRIDEIAIVGPAFLWEGDLE